MATKESTLAVVIPVFNEDDNLPALSDRLRTVLSDVAGVRWTVIYVNDGSQDDSLATILAQRDHDSRFAVVDLSRNFGHQLAITAGLAHADADAVVVMDADLQDPPEVIPLMVAAWRNGAQVVFAKRRSRQETGIRRLAFNIFHSAFSWLSDFPVPAETGVFSLLDRRAVEEFNNLRETNRFIPGLRSWIGFEQRTILYDRHERAAGFPKQTLVRLVRYGMDALLSFSYKPLRAITVLGLVGSSIGLVLAGTFVAKRLLGLETAETGFTTLVTLICFFGGTQLISVGLLGEYLGRVYDEVKQRPLYIVRARHGLAAEGPSTLAFRRRETKHSGGSARGDGQPRTVGQLSDDTADQPPTR